MTKNEFALAFNEVLEDKQLPREIILGAIESAMVSAYRRAVNASSAQHVEARVDPDTGQVLVYAEEEVVEEVLDERTEVILEEANVRVSTLPLDHRIYTNGFLFRELPGERRLRAEVARRYGIDKAYFRKIKQGADAIAADGTPVPNTELTDPPTHAASYAYCSDTAYKPELPAWIAGVDTLYHEATFLEKDASLASKTGHSTAREAARIAREAGVRKLILGHYSTRYKDLKGFQAEAEDVFPGVELAGDGKVFSW